MELLNLCQIQNYNVLRLINCCDHCLLQAICVENNSQHNESASLKEAVRGSLS